MSGRSRDPLAANEKLFGLNAGFDKEMYTTKLDRNAPDFKEASKAQRLANEIMNVRRALVTPAPRGTSTARPDCSTSLQQMMPMLQRSAS